MPSKNSIKVYVENGHYHVYNRGVEKRIIFQDEQDYKVFLRYLSEHLSSPSQFINSLQGASLPRRLPRNHSNEVELLAFCLMPNHFHLLLKQNTKNGMENFMRSLATRYSMYFNKKYKRVGKLFQGYYKAAFVDNDNYLLHISRYIHTNPNEYTKNLEGAYSSYAEYLGNRETNWIKPNEILTYFANNDFLKLSNTNSYKKFVESYAEEVEDNLGNLKLED